MSMQRLLPSTRRAKEVAGTLLATLIIYALTALQGAFLSRALGPLQRGQFAAALFYGQLLTGIGLIGGPLASAAFAAKFRAEAARARSRAAILGIVTGTVSFIVAAGLCLLAMPPEKRDVAWLGVVFALTIPFEHVRQNLMGVDHGGGRFQHYNWSRLFGAVAAFALLVVTWVAGMRSLWWLVGACIVAAALSLLQWLLTVPSPRFEAGSMTSVRSLVRQAAPFGASTMSSDLYGKFDGLLVQWLGGFVGQGFYAAASAAAGSLVLVPNVGALFIFNMGATGESAGRKGVLRKRLILAAGVQAASGIVLALFVRRLIVLVFGAEFEAAGAYALALIPAYVLIGFNGLLEAYLRGSGRPMAVIASKVPGFIAMAIASVLLFPRYGVIGVALGATIGACAVTTANLVVLARGAKV